MNYLTVGVKVECNGAIRHVMSHGGLREKEQQPHIYQLKGYSG